jgi:hypothetical protein
MLMLTSADVLWMAWLPHIRPLLADLDVDAIIKIVFFVILIFGSALAKLVSNVFENASKQPPPPPAERMRGQAGKARPAVPATDPLRREVGDFLKRFGVEVDQSAEQRRKEPILVAEEVREQRGAQRRPKAPGQGKPGSGGTARKSPPPTPPRPAQRPKLVPSRGDRRTADRPARKGVGQHVQEHLDAGRIRQHAASLGSRISNADERVEARLRETFQHSLGQLTHDKDGVFEVGEGTDSATWSDRPGGPNAAVESIRRLLSTPASVRDAVVLSEILRPVHNRESPF